MNLTELSAFELNKFRFSGNHTPLTPEQIEAIRTASDSASGSDSDSDAENKAKININL